MGRKEGWSEGLILHSPMPDCVSLCNIAALQKKPKRHHASKSNNIRWIRWTIWRYSTKNLGPTVQTPGRMDAYTHWPTHQCSCIAVGELVAPGSGTDSAGCTV
jgi:hypothetical protein